ncbi:hypothetical protein, partial [Listeria monocytogenes]|uniref:hypothetical protein n=1 Tax=Listeria monocytogenes TaxID=1639 RepID=UPI002FDC640A
MTDMPERIWASEYFADVIPCAGDWTGEQPETPDGSSEYIRADVAEARVAAALERAATCTEW